MNDTLIAQLVLFVWDSEADLMCWVGRLSACCVEEDGAILIFSKGLVFSLVKVAAFSGPLFVTVQKSNYYLLCK